MATTAQERDDVVFGQINLHKGAVGATNLMSYLSSRVRTDTPSQPFYSRPGNVERANGKKAKGFLMCLQEPPVLEGKVDQHGRLVRPGRVVHFGRSHHVIADSTCVRQRAAILASKNLNLWPLPEFISGDVVACQWMGLGFEVVIASVYLDIQLAAVIPAKLEELVRYCRSERKEMILCIDSNAHSTLWNCRENNPRGDRLEEFIFRHNLRVRNEGDHFTYYRYNARTIIDITLTSGVNLDKIFTNWRVSEEVQGSDHLLVEWQLTISLTKKRLIRNMDRGDWNVFQAHMEEADWFEQASWTADELDKAVDSFEKNITDALDKSHPKHVAKIKVRSISDTDERIKRWKKKLRACYSWYRKTGTEHAWDKFVQARKDYKYMIRRCKRESWQEFCEDADNMQKAARLTKIIQGGTAQIMGLMKRNDGTMCSSPMISMIHVVNTHFPGNKLAQPQTEREGQVGMGWRQMSPFITTDHVRAAIETFGDKKAPGPDGIQPCVLKHLGDKALERLTNLFKVSYAMGYVPQAWRRAKVIFLPKPGRKDYSQPWAFRPITLSSFLVKTMERVILWHITKEHLVQDPLSDNQHAFRSGRSTETALTDMVAEVEKALSTQGFALATFLDIQGAFDNVGADAIERGMREKHLPEELVQWYSHFVRNRKMMVDHNGIKLERFLVTGTPQGGVLSPVIWNMVFDSFLALFKEGFVRAKGFADDASLITLGMKPMVMMSRMQKAVDKALEWGRQNSLSFSPPKTVVVLFTRKRKFDMPQPLKMGDFIVPFSDTARYLGVYLDSKLSWKYHVKSKVAEAKSKLLRVRNAMGKLWGTRPLITRWIYANVIRPALSYGSLLWAQVCSKEWAQAEFRKVNRLAMLHLGSFRRSTPTAGMEVMFDVMPLHIQLQYEACLGLFRTSHTKDGDGRTVTYPVIPNGHRQFCQRLVEELQLPMDRTDRIEQQLVFNLEFGLDRNSFEKGVPTHFSNKHELYTDGSGYQDCFGSGAAVFLGQAKKDSEMASMIAHLGEASSVFQGEVYGIKKAAEWISAHVDRRTVTIYSDSRAALLALRKCKVKSALVLDTQAALNRACRRNKIILSWVKAHNGHHGNETADELAKLGALNESMRVDDLPAPPEAYIKQRYRQGFRKMWQKYWENRPDCRQTKDWLPKISKQMSYSFLCLHRRELSWVVQLVTGHNFLKRHDALVNEDEDSECRLCMEDEETSWHILTACPAIAVQRQMVFGAAFRQAPLQWSTKEVARFLREADVGSLLDQADGFGLVG